MMQVHLSSLVQLTSQRIACCRTCYARVPCSQQQEKHLSTHVELTSQIAHFRSCYAYMTAVAAPSKSMCTPLCSSPASPVHSAEAAMCVRMLCQSHGITGSVRSWFVCTPHACLHAVADGHPPVYHHTRQWSWACRYICHLSHFSESAWTCALCGQANELSTLPNRRCLIFALYSQDELETIIWSPA